MCFVLEIFPQDIESIDLLEMQVLCCFISFLFLTMYNEHIWCRYLFFINEFFCLSLYISVRGFILLKFFFTKTKLNIWVDFSTLRRIFPLANRQLYPVVTASQ